jgi:hypothetical protein
MVQVSLLPLSRRLFELSIWNEGAGKAVVKARCWATYFSLLVGLDGMVSFIQIISSFVESIDFSEISAYFS